MLFFLCLVLSIFQPILAFTGNLRIGARRGLVRVGATLVMIAESSSKLRVLALHGFYSSSRMFDVQLSALQRATADIGTCPYSYIFQPSYS